MLTKNLFHVFDGEMIKFATGYVDFYFALGNEWRMLDSQLKERVTCVCMDDNVKKQTI